ncbi:nucleoside deoxyribosyltransferase [Haloarcula tailed virus 2]|uniref:Nucleoside deoxyribosyltransferase n=1 Tax=Haloarcula tailed virus 2 TaxID=2877989 RepID=A0AAE8XZJ4_9CAUD|nr:nucleoside deoxyribosyltransferase [Haloarcula tailed virus 2]UBF23202.1 nucleoside deoxyribosyltransferase [Haloarcula tailed virus 2]
MSRELPKIYLGGSITENPDGQHGNSWRIFTESTYDWLDWVNPLDSEDPEEDEYTSTYYRDLVDLDLDLIDSCEGFLYYYQDYAMSIGTGQEQFYAWNMGLPVVVVYEGDPADLSPFVIAHCDAIVTSIEWAVEELERLVEEMYMMVEEPREYLNNKCSENIDEWDTFFTEEPTTETLMDGAAEGYYEEDY